MNCRIKSGNDDAKLAHACIRGDRSNATKTLRTGRHRRGASVQPVLLADADGAGAQGLVGGLSAETIPWCFTEKDAIAPHNSEKVPVLIDGESSVADSWAIANYLEDRYPDRPSLFGGAGGRAMGRMINWWGDVTVIGGMFPLIVADIPGHLKPVDAVYFRQSREARFGKPLEEVMAGREKTVEGFRRSLDPMRLTLKTQAYLGGDAPNYADYIVFGGFQWARVVSPFRLLAENDPVHAWREKLLDAFDGMARKSPGYPV